MLTIIKRFELEAAHRLPKHQGACQRIHGHRYELEVGVSGSIDPKTGMIADFKNIKDLVKREVIEHLDHYYLNDLQHLPGFPVSCPTAENMVLWIVAKLQGQLKVTGCSLALVRLWETSSSWVEWRE